MLRVLQEDKMTVKHFYPAQDQILWRHRLFCSVLTRPYAYNNAAFLKLKNEGFQNVAHSVTDYIGHVWTKGQSATNVFGFKMSRYVWTKPESHINDKKIEIVLASPTSNKGWTRSGSKTRNPSAPASISFSLALKADNKVQQSFEKLFHRVSRRKFGKIRKKYLQNTM